MLLYRFGLTCGRTLGRTNLRSWRWILILQRRSQPRPSPGRRPAATWSRRHEDAPSFPPPSDTWPDGSIAVTWSGFLKSPPPFKIPPSYRVRRWHLTLVLIRAAGVPVVPVVSVIVQQEGVHPQGGLWELSWSCHFLLGGVGLLLCVGVLAGGVGHELLFIWGQKAEIWWHRLHIIPFLDA